MLLFGEIVDSGVPQSSRLSVISHVAFFILFYSHVAIPPVVYVLLDRYN